MSVRFDAATDQLTRANPPSVSGGITLTCWAYVSVDQNDFSTFARIHASGSTITTWATSSDGTSGPNYFTGGGSVSNSTGTPVGSWRKIAVSCSGTTGKSYVQDPGSATEVDSGTVSSSGTPTQIALGGRGGGDTSEWLNGRLAYFRVWSAELSQSEIEAEWSSTTPVRTSGLWADWPLTVHTDLTDHSGNGRDLTAGSTAVTTEADPPILEVITGALAASIPLPTSAIDGDVVLAGDFTASIPLPTAALAGDTIDPGQLDTSIPLPVAGLAGDTVQVGALAASIPLPVAGLAGDVVLAGALAASLPLPHLVLDDSVVLELVLPLRAGDPVLTAWAGGPAALAGGWRTGAPA